MTIGAFITPACARAPPPAHAYALHTAQLREQAARTEAAVQDAENYARLGPRERFERRIARLNREHPAAYGVLHPYDGRSPATGPAVSRTSASVAEDSPTSSAR
ncbi:hypothetical protein [Streptomyces clavifer]|uniref:hypothetical protein n=1 Tax=Streptomyces clavifer TaxID=68188 RepID=UPI00371581A4